MQKAEEGQTYHKTKHTRCSPRKAPPGRNRSPRRGRKMFPTRPSVKAPNVLNHLLQTRIPPIHAKLGHLYLISSADRRGGGLLVVCVPLCRLSSSPEALRQPIRTSPPRIHTRLPRGSNNIAYKMAARIPASQVPAMFARRQPRVLQTARREFSHPSNTSLELAERCKDRAISKNPSPSLLQPMSST